MPEKARVFFAEDDGYFRDVIKRRLEEAGHEVVLEAHTLNEAIQSIPQFKDSGIQVAVLDGNLDEDDISGYDGRLMAQKIKEQVPHVTTIGLSQSPIDGVDIDLGKRKFTQLASIITNL